MRASQSPALQNNRSRPRRRLAEEQPREPDYYLERMQNRSAVVIVLTDGSMVRGRIEWYDRACLSIEREDGVRLVLYKHAIRCFVEPTDGAGPGSDPI